MDALQVDERGHRQRTQRVPPRGVENARSPPSQKDEKAVEQDRRGDLQRGPDHDDRAVIQRGGRSRNQNIARGQAEVVVDRHRQVRPSEAVTPRVKQGGQVVLVIPAAVRQHSQPGQLGEHDRADRERVRIDLAGCVGGVRDRPFGHPTRRMSKTPRSPLLDSAVEPDGTCRRWKAPWPSTPTECPLGFIVSVRDRQWSCHSRDRRRLPRVDQIRVETAQSHAATIALSQRRAEGADGSGVTGPSSRKTAPARAPIARAR